MRLIAISSVKNEQDIVEAFVRHTTAMCDHLLVVDHHSTDDTREILEALIEEGLPLQVLTADRQTTSQSERTTPLMHTAASMGANWVLPLDADEFLDATRSELEDALSMHDVPVLVRWRSFVPTEHDSAVDLNPVTRIRRRLREEIFAWSKVMVPRGVAATGTLFQGSHDVAQDGGSLPRQVLEGIALAHFPIRSAEQYAMKVAIANLHWTALGNREDSGFHYLEPFERLLRGWLDFAADFATDALRYAVPPLVTGTPELVDWPLSYRGGSLRHTPATRPEPWPHVLRYALGLAEGTGAMRRQGTRSSLDGAAPAPVDVDSLRRELEATRTALRDTTGSLEIAVGEIALSKQTLHELSSRNQAMLMSTSWRVTRPLRAFGRFVRRVLGHNR